MMQLASYTYHQLAETERPPEEYGEPRPPDHWHVTTSMLVRLPHILGGGKQKLQLAPPEQPWRLWHEQGAWRVAGPGHGGKDCPYPRDLATSTYEVLSWPDGPNLDPLTEYLITHHQDRSGCALELIHA